MSGTVNHWACGISTHPEALTQHCPPHAADTAGDGGAREQQVWVQDQVSTLGTDDPGARAALPFQMNNVPWNHRDRLPAREYTHTTNDFKWQTQCIRNNTLTEQIQQSLKCWVGFFQEVDLKKSWKWVKAFLQWQNCKVAMPTQHQASQDDIHYASILIISH